MNEVEKVRRGLLAQTIDPQTQRQAPMVSGIAGLAGLASVPLSWAESLWGTVKGMGQDVQEGGYGNIKLNDAAELAAEATGLGWGAGVKGALQHGIDPATLAAAFGGKRHARALDNMYHGVSSGDSLVTSNMSKKDKVATEGFQKGRSAELNLEGTSITPDPRVAYGFGDRNISNVLKVDTDVRPSEVFNLRPSEYLAGNAPQDVKLLRKPQSYFSEAEYWIPGQSRPMFQPREMSRRERGQAFAAMGMQDFPTNVSWPWRLKDYEYGSMKQQGNYKDLLRDKVYEPMELSYAAKEFANKFYPWVTAIYDTLRLPLQEYGMLQKRLNRIEEPLNKIKEKIKSTEKLKGMNKSPAELAKLYDDLYRRKNQLAEEIRDGLRRIDVPQGAALRDAEMNLWRFQNHFPQMATQSVIEEATQAVLAMPDVKTPQEAMRRIKALVFQETLPQTAQPEVRRAGKLTSGWLTDPDNQQQLETIPDMFPQWEPAQ